MPESGPYGSVRGALSNERPYRDPALASLGRNDWGGFFSSLLGLNE
jgi:hypothetical protein